MHTDEAALYAHLRPHRLQLVARAPVRGGPAAVEQAGCGEREKAATLAAELGAYSWTPEHDSTPFALTVRRGVNYLFNKAVFWSIEDGDVEVQEGMDDVTLALTADAWSRTGRVSVRAESASSGTVRLRSGMPIAVDAARLDTPRLSLALALKPLQQLDRSQCEIEHRFGTARREWVVLEMAYSGAPPCV